MDGFSFHDWLRGKEQRARAMLDMVGSFGGPGWNARSVAVITGVAVNT